MANQPKSVKQLESELQVAQEAANKIAKDFAEAKKAEAEKLERASKAAEKRARKTRIARKAEFDILAINYEDVLIPTPAPKAPMSPAKSERPAPKQESKPVEKQKSTESKKTGPWAWLNEKA